MSRKLQNLPNIPRTTTERATQYEILMPLLQAMYREFKEFTSKKPEATLSKQKVEIVNRLLKDILILLEDEPNRQYLDLLNIDDLPQNSDVLLILSQIKAAMEAFYKLYYTTDGLSYEHKWQIE